MLAVVFMMGAAPVLSAHPPPKAPLARIVSLAPAITEIVCALGACDKIVGVTRFDDFPSQVRGLPKVGGFIDPSLEAVLSLRPDAVLMNPNSGNRGFVERLTRGRVPWAALPDTALADYEPTVLELSRLLDQPHRGQELVERFERSLKRLEVQRHPGICVPSSRDSPAGPLAASPPPAGPLCRPARAVLVYDHRPLVVAGPGSFGSELLALAGLANAYGGAQRFATLEFEALLSLAPDLIVDVDMGSMGQSHPEYYDPIAARLRAKQIPVVFAPDPALLRLGPRLPEAMGRLLARLATRTPP